MVFTPIISGGKWKPVPDPDGIMVLYEYDTSGKNVTNTLTGLTKENLKKGCLLYIRDNNSACVLYVHEDGKIELNANSEKYSLVGPATLSNATTGVLLTGFNPQVFRVVIGLE